MGVLIPLIMSGVAAYDRRQKEAEKVPREKFLDALEKSAAMGETNVFNDPKTYKSAEKYGITPVYEILNHLVNSDLSTEQRAGAVARLREQRSGSEAGQAGNENETQRQRTIMRPAISGIAKGQQQRQQQNPGSSGLPVDEPAEMAIATSPVQKGSGAGQVQAEVQGQKSQERIAGERTKLGYYDTNARIQQHASEIEMQQKQLDEKKRTTPNWETDVDLKKQHLAVEQRRTDIMALDTKNRSRQLDLQDREQRTGLVEKLIEGTDLPVGKAAKASREMMSFFEGKTDTLSPETEAATGFSTKKITAIKGVMDEARKYEDESRKLVQDVVGAIRAPSSKQTKLKPEEIDSQLARANELAYKAVAYKYGHKLLDGKEATNEILTNTFVQTSEGKIVSLATAGAGFKYSTPLPQGIDRMLNGKGKPTDAAAGTGDANVLTPAQQAIVDKFSGGPTTPQGTNAPATPPDRTLMK